MVEDGIRSHFGEELIIRQRLLEVRQQTYYIFRQFGIILTSFCELFLHHEEMEYVLRVCLNEHSDVLLHCVAFQLLLLLLLRRLSG